MRRYSDAEQLTTRKTASSKAEDPFIKRHLAEIKLAQGDPVAAQALLELIPLDFNPAPYIWGTRFKAALYLRDYDASSHVLAMPPSKWSSHQMFDGPSEWAQGQIARARGDRDEALSTFAAARKKEDAWSGDKPKDASYFSSVATIDAGLGRKEEAI